VLINLRETAFIKSFRAKSFVPAFILDFVYYLILLCAGSFYVYRILPEFLNTLDAVEILQNNSFASAAEFIAEIETTTQTWTSFKIYTVIFAVLLFANYCIFKYLVCKKIQVREQQLNEIVKSIGIFAVLNIIALLFYVSLTITAYYILVLEYFNIFLFVVLPIIIIYTQNLIHPLFVESRSLRETIKAYYIIGVKNVHVFIIPYCIMTAGLIFVMYLVSLLVFLPAAVYTAVYVMAFTAYLLWCKYYIFTVKQKVHIPQKQKKEKKQ
jgi:hypothetical protein